MRGPISNQEPGTFIPAPTDFPLEEDVKTALRDFVRQYSSVTNTKSKEEIRALAIAIMAKASNGYTLVASLPVDFRQKVIDTLRAEWVCIQASDTPSAVAKELYEIYAPAVAPTVIVPQLTPAPTKPPQSEPAVITVTAMPQVNEAALTDAVLVFNFSSLTAENIRAALRLLATKVGREAAQKVLIEATGVSKVIDIVDEETGKALMLAIKEALNG